MKKATQKPTTATSTALSVASLKEQVPQMIETLKEKLKSLKGDVKEKISTNVDYEGQKISEIKEVSRLLQTSARIHAMEKAYNEEIARYNLQKKPIKKFAPENKTVAQWEQIIAKAINDLINKTEIEKVENAIKKLSTHLDENTKLQNELEGIMNSAEAVIS